MVWYALVWFSDTQINIFVEIVMHVFQDSLNEENIQKNHTDLKSEIKFCIDVKIFTVAFD